MVELIGYDWFHNGAFPPTKISRTSISMWRSRDGIVNWCTNYHHDDYDLFMQAGSAGDLSIATAMSSWVFGTS